MSEVSKGGVYLLLGDDRAAKLQRVHALERSLSIHPLDHHRVDASSLASQALLALCRQQAAASACRLIVVDEAHRLDRAAVEALHEHAAAIRQTACVLLLIEAELPAKHPVLTLQSIGTLERFAGRDAPAAKPFALVDALGSRQTGEALKAAHDQVLAGKDPLELLGLIAWQVQRWVMVKRLLRGGGSIEGIAAAVGLRPWQVERLQSEVAGRTLERLQQLLERCGELDRDAKRGRAIPWLAVEQVILEICADGRPPAGVTRFARGGPGS